jgi:hypothetical protein
MKRSVPDRAKDAAASAPVWDTALTVGRWRVA